jgi:Lantibiotic biosynthesis dehydratase C-term
MTPGSPPPPRVHLGIVAYVWGALHQDRLLLDCIAPAVADLRRQGLAHRFWLDRFDARGPHVFAVLTLAREAAPEIAGRLAARLSDHLAAHPSSKTLIPEQLARRHEETRQRRQCEADGRPGFAANNSFEIFEHPPRGYPFWLSAGLAGEEELWDLVADLTLWTIGRLAARPGSPAIAAARRWIASIDRELRLAGGRPEEYWRYHVPTLIPDLFAAMGPEEKDAALTELAAGVGTRHPDLVQAWQEVATAGPVWPGLPRMINLILRGSPEPFLPWPLLREIDHCVLKQLGVPAVLQIPPTLYAWRRSSGEGRSLRNADPSGLAPLP